jgi:hypothetical protein
LGDDEGYSKEKEAQKLMYKVAESPYLNKINQRVDTDKALGYKKSSLAFKMEDFSKQKIEIDEKLKEHKSQIRR